LDLPWRKSNLLKSVDVGELLSAFLADDDGTIETQTALKESSLVNNILPGTHPTASHVIFGGVDKKSEIGAIEHPYEDFGNRLPHTSLGLECLDFNAEANQEVPKITPRLTAPVIANEDMGARYEGSHRHIFRCWFLRETIIRCFAFEHLDELVNVIYARELNLNSTAVGGIEIVVKFRSTLRRGVCKRACHWITTISVKPGCHGLEGMCFVVIKNYLVDSQPWTFTVDESYLFRS
jgi:hypothetical protein